MSQDSNNHLARGLSNRHIQLIALGGAIGSGLFLGSAPAIGMAGPAILVGYGIGGLIAFLIMRQLAEMAVEEPVAGSFSYFAYRYWGKFAGFCSGWNYWMLYVLVSMSELSAAAKCIHQWFPLIPLWVSVLSCFILVNFINLMAVKVYGEVEFFFAIIKVIAIISMIIFGCYLLFADKAGPDASFTNLWAHGGFFPFGFTGLILALPIIMFSFGGLELIGITSAEADDPTTTIPKATNQVIYRVLVFYIGALAILLSLQPWSSVNPNDSAFVTIFHNIDQSIISNIFNFVVLTAALSVYNSGLYCNSRMLYGLAEQGNAPRKLMLTNHRGTPVYAVIFSGLATLSAVVLNYIIPQEAFILLMALVVSSLVINWVMICLTHIMFKRKLPTGYQTKFKAICYPFGNIICLAFLLGILVILYQSSQFRISVELIPVWLAFLGVSYGIKCYFSCKITESKD